MAIETRPSCPREIRCDSEQDRIRDLSRYYCTFERDPGTTDSPCLSHDPTLTALTQLGVYRFGCDRSFVSIIDGEQQHLISEATASISLRNKEQHLPNNGIYLGVRTLDLQWGVCPHAIRLFTGQDPSKITDTKNITANRTRNIIRDFTSEVFYKDRPYVQEWPYFRFYAEVPLYSPSGYVLGSYCVVDNKTRDEFGDADVAALQEIADSISQHLENVRIVHYHLRAESLVKGLTNFVKGDAASDSVDHLDTLLLSPDEHSLHKLNSSNIGTKGKRHLVSPLTSKSLSSTSAFDQSTTQNGGALSLFSEAKDTVSTQPTTQTLSLAPGSPESTEAIFPDEDNSEPEIDDGSVAEHVAAIFHRASNLLKASMDLDGVVFLDARQSDSQFDLSDDFENGGLPLNDDNHAFIDPKGWFKDSNTTGSWPRDQESVCRSLDPNMNILPRPIDPTGSESQLTLSENFLRMLIQAFPRGQAFDMENEPPGSDVLQQEAFRRLAHNLPDAKSILFMPLWDWNKSRWLAGTFVWTRDNRRPLGVEELHYFKVFGDSIISEVSRVYWNATERSKFDFVSSISHELRSPLHGILGSTELMQSSPLLSSQHDMIKMIERSGLTLLDTIDHLLEYCKINDLATQKSDFKVEREIIGQGSEFDLGALVEQVATVLCVGQRSQLLTNIPDKPTTTTPDIGTINHHPSGNDKVSVVVRVEQLDSWVVRSASGAWRRIVMNIIGNAMNWTNNGLIEVTLSNLTPESDSCSSFAHLCVRDTGSGISRDFLKDQLFSPFAQEDPLSPGVGLGLSITHKLVTSLGGNIDIKSEQGAGTQVDIRVPIQYLKQSNSSSTKASTPFIQATIIGLQSHPDIDQIPSGILSVDAKRKFSIQNALIDVFAEQLGWQLSSANSLVESSCEVCIIEEADLQRMLTDHLLPMTGSKHALKYLIVLGGKIPCWTGDLPANIIRVSPPFGPQSLLDAAKRLMEIYQSPVQAGASDSVSISPFTMTDQQTSCLPVSENSKETSHDAPLIRTFNTTLSIDQPETILQQSHSSQAYVLLVDDNDINLKIMSTFMRKLGYLYETASNGLMALEKYSNSKRRFHFVLMDISMPVMDGLVSTRKIREYEQSEGLAPSRIMAVTAVASNDTREAAVKAGVDDYLIKPLSLRKLGTTMRVV